MADINLDTPSFGIVDTIASSSQELVDSFLDNDGSTTSSPDDIKDIKEETTPPAKTTSKKEEEKKEEKAPILTLDDIKEDDEEEEEEESTKPAKKKQEEEKQEEEEPVDSDFNAFSAFSKELYKLGAFIHDEDGEPEIPTTPEEFLATFNEQVGKKADMAVDNFISRFGEDYQEAFDAIFVKGVSPKEYYQTYNNIQSFSDLDLSVEANQESVVRQTLKDMDYEDEDIQTEIERLKNYGDLEEVAKKHHKVLIKKESQKLQQLAEKQAAIRQQQAEVKKQFVNNVSTTLQEKLKTKDFDGIPINPKLATEVQDMLVTEKWKNSAGETLTDFDVEILNLKRPENHAMKVKVALLLKMLKNDPTLSSIKKAGVTTQTNSLFSEVVRNKPRTETSTGKKSQHWSNL